MPRLRDFRGIHYGESIVVCGLGASINAFREPRRFRTIGVNDIGRAFTPDYLFVMDGPQSFSPERFQYIRDSTARYVFTDHDLGLARGNVVKFPIRTSPQPRFDDPDTLYLIGRPPTSPFLAVCLAAHLGAKAIGLVGVDFTNGHFFARDGAHKLSAQVAGIDRRFYTLGSALLDRGVKVFNLSAESRMSAFPRLSPDEFYAIQRSGRTRAWSRPVRRVCLESSAAIDENIARIATLINSRTTLSCRIVAPRSPDIAPGAAREIENDIKSRSQVRIDCEAVQLPVVQPDGPDFLRTWHAQLRPLLFGRPAATERNGARRPLTVAVIVSQENATGDELAETVRSLWPDLLPSDALTVLGRNPPLGTIPEWVRHSPRIAYLEQRPGESFIAARNRAASLAVADILVFSDANIQAPRHWVDVLIGAFARNQVAAAGPAIADMYERQSKGFGMKWADDQLNTVWLPASSQRPYPVPLLTGAFLAVRRKVFRQAGGFDSGMLSTGGDDVELCFRLWTAGFECRVAPQLEVLWMNPYASGAVRVSQYWNDLLHNLLRLATVHFSSQRLNAFVKALASDAAFPGACARLLASDASRRRQWMEQNRRRPDQWFFERFAG